MLAFYQFFIMIKDQLPSILNWIESNIHTRILISQICFTFFCSRRNLQREFKKHYGTPIGIYIRTKRLCIAVDMLLLRGMKIIEVSDELGFDSPQTFSRDFKKILGIKPSDLNRMTVQNVTSSMNRILEIGT
jgi:AraC-like DNA-binding protein